MNARGGRAPRGPVRAAHGARGRSVASFPFRRVAVAFHLRRETRVFRRLARWVTAQSDGLTLVPWRADGTRKFLIEQFGDHLFVVVMIDVDTGVIHAGSEMVGSVRSELRCEAEQA